MPSEPTAETSDIDGDLQGGTFDGDYYITRVLIFPLDRFVAPVLANQLVETFDWNEHWGSVDESKSPGQELGIVPHWTPESPYPDKIVWVPSNSTTLYENFLTPEYLPH